MEKFNDLYRELCYGEKFDPDLLLEARDCFLLLNNRKECLDRAITEYLIKNRYSVIQMMEVRDD